MPRGRSSGGDLSASHFLCCSAAHLFVQSRIEQQPRRPEPAAQELARITRRCLAFLAWERHGWHLAMTSHIPAVVMFRYPVPSWQRLGRTCLYKTRSFHARFASSPPHNRHHIHHPEQLHQSYKQRENQPPQAKIPIAIMKVFAVLALVSAAAAVPNGCCQSGTYSCTWNNKGWQTCSNNQWIVSISSLPWPC